MEFKEEWITQGIDQETVQVARKMAEDLATKGISTSQLRNFFGEIKKIQAIGMDEQKGKSRLLMVAPKLAYTIGRMDGERDRDKAAALSQLLKNVEQATIWIMKADSQKRFNHFVDYMEAIVAYHKFSQVNQ